MKSRQKELDFLKSFSCQTGPQHVSLSFPPVPETSGGREPPKLNMKVEWFNFLKKIISASYGATTKLSLNCEDLNLKQLEDLVTIIKESNCNINEMDISNIRDLIPYSMSYSSL